MGDAIAESLDLYQGSVCFIVL